MPTLAGALFVLAGLGFKLAAVPFHFWCPDVFEGAAAEVAAFLSVASKGAALALTTRFVLAAGGPAGGSSAYQAAGTLGLALAALAVVTMTLGNLAALSQTNLKRLLAYSTIAHAGYMLLALVPLTPAAAGPLLFYLPAYLVMNLGAFAVVAIVRNATGSEELSAYRGLIGRQPLLAVTFALFLLSLLGLPPLVGFAAKFQIFAGLADASRSTNAGYAGLGGVYVGLLVVAALNTVVSAAYYLSVVKAMVLDAPDDGAATPLKVAFRSRAYVAILAALVVAGGVLWGPLTDAGRKAAASLGREVRP